MATNGVNGAKHYNEGTFLFTVSLCRHSAYADDRANR